MGRETNLNQVQIKDGFWTQMQELVTDVVIPFQERVLHDAEKSVERSHAIENFRIAAGLAEGEFYGMVFQDSDVANWLEGVAYSLVIRPDAGLEARADAIIDIVAQAQQEDGYLNTYFTIKEPEHRWQNLLECHELYCAGHMMEAAAAYYETTGKDKLLHVMERMADLAAEDGYLYLHRSWGGADEVAIEFEMPVRKVYANTKVCEDVGCVSIMRGPVVYCFEGVDNGEDIQELFIDRELSAQTVDGTDGVLGGMTLPDIAGKRLIYAGGDDLYSGQAPRMEHVALRAIHYFAWGNRGLNQMRVWMHEER